MSVLPNLGKALVGFPALPPSPKEYAQDYHERVNNILRLWGNAMSQVLNDVVGTYGGRFLSLPSGAFYNTGTVTAALANTAYAVGFTNTSFSNGVTLVGGNSLQVQYSGAYNFQFTAGGNNTDTVPHDVSIWVRVNGVDVPNSCTNYAIDDMASGVPGFDTLAWNFILQLKGGDSVQLMWSTVSTLVTLIAQGTQTSPTRPATPSVTGSLQFVSLY